ncbi:39S ribosomal protein L37, mitochondrial [Dendroctonus ponderosae]
MRPTPTLFKQNIGWHFRKLWHIKGNRKVLDIGSEKILKKQGIATEDPNEFIKDFVVTKPERVEIVGIRGPRKTTIDNWHERPLLTYGHANVLLQGLTQAKVLTNTVEVVQGLPENYSIEDISRQVNKRVKDVILASCVLDAEQKLLPHIKDRNRPAYVFPRAYGITQQRVFKLLISRLLHLIETTSAPELVRQRHLADNLLFSYPFERNGDLIQFQQLGDLVMLAEKPLAPITRQSLNEFQLPDLFPVSPTVTLQPTNKYVLRNVYPVNKTSRKYHPHTLFINYNKETVKNLFEEEVTQEQICGRTLLKAFTAAAAYAKEQFGDEVKDLPTPVTLQAIQTDGREFYFGVLQLNTLDLSSTETRNIWYQSPVLRLFEKCAYELGRPVLHDYNRAVVNHILAFYNRN